MVTNIRFGRAKKDYPDSEIKKGQLYYVWTMWGKRDFRSLKPPRPSQLTASEKIKTVRVLRETLEDILEDVYLGGWRTTPESIASDMMYMASKLEEVAELYIGSVGEMQSHFTKSYNAERIKELVGKAGGLSLEIEGLADELQDAGEENMFAILQKAHALPEWELF